MMVTTSKIPAGVLPAVKAKCAEVVSRTGVVTHVWGYNTIPDHNNRRCIDFMVANLTDGDKVANYLRANAARLGVVGIIWNRRVMGFPENGDAYRGPSGQWRPYSGPSPHTDHNHVEFNASAYVAPSGDALASGGSGPAPLAPDTSEEIDMSVAEDLQNQINRLSAVVDARTSPQIPGTRLVEMSAQLGQTRAQLDARTSPRIPGARLEAMSALLRDVDSDTGPANPIVAHARGISAYEQIPGIRTALADLARQLAEIRDTPDDNVRQALADAGDALRRAAAELDPIPEYDPDTTSTTQDGA